MSASKFLLFPPPKGYFGPFWVAMEWFARHVTIGTLRTLRTKGTAGSKAADLEDGC